MSEDRLVDRQSSASDESESSFRPLVLDDFIGQRQAKANLKVFIEAARSRAEALDHVLFAGPPGLGKTTLAQIVARELGVNFKATSGLVIAKAGDLAALRAASLWRRARPDHASSDRGPPPWPGGA